MAKLVNVAVSEAVGVILESSSLSSGTKKETFPQWKVFLCVNVKWQRPHGCLLDQGWKNLRGNE